MDGYTARGDSARRWEHADSFALYIAGLSHVDACIAVGMVSDHSKTNQVGILAPVQGLAPLQMCAHCILTLLACRLIEANGDER